ncbi:FAD/NAD(P)-binding domain-containing protein [Aaosphaeria arxii CBS 175.79]|uniref:FAD/NAD(P)-binding domain-containing protein n=1 Tax=Aaosphaeria arxii CBS 175.79 TaxID=1450172 RepID=A0A6A5XSV2_9PLEO|nr:FAD/NAD(P)-binding domain-containing protein [Aaosphaeria arxii CBS 175.79]KAF2015831.1 FAD/NAD(P)-binding domain-containing protein [Aaosphaeria arxii CBS 175.79]
MAGSDFNVAIVGAGIGGLGLAIGLSHLNIPFTIYEAAPAFSAVGAGVGLGPNALRSMDLIDHRFRDMYMNIATGNLRPEKKHVMMEAMRMEEGLGEGESWWGNGGWGASYFERTGAHRKDLLDIMTSFIDRGNVRFNVRVKEMKQNGGTVLLEFDNGEVANHAVVVGCDGVKGFSRSVVLGERYPDCVEPKYADRYVYRTIVSMEDAKEIVGDLATDAKMYIAKGANFSTYPISEGRAVNVVAFKEDKTQWTAPDTTYEVSKEQMLADFEEFRIDSRLKRLLDRAQPVRWGVFHHPETPTYYNSQICLLGDVAHAGGPHQGGGAGQCLEDALILSRVLGKLFKSTPDDILTKPSPLRTELIEAAFEAYDEIRRPRAQKQVLTSEECGNIYILKGQGVGDDMSKVLENLNSRFEWIWLHDLEGDVRKVEERWDEIVGDSRFQSNLNGKI